MIPPSATPDVADGRVRRGARNREAIVDALLGFYDAGVLRPSAADVAARAGVSARSVHNHFADMESLRAEVAQRQWERFAHLGGPVPPDQPLATRVEQVVARRAELFEAVTPVRRAALLYVHESPTIAANLAQLDRTLRRQLERAFARELACAPPETLDALDAVLSWDTWNRMRRAQRCSVPRASRTLATILHALLAEGSSP